MTYSEFLEENDINHLGYINFTNEKTTLLNITIHDNPSRYIDVARRAKKLDFILVPKVESHEYYKNLRKFVENCRDEVLIRHNFLDNATREEFLQGEDIIESLLEEINQDWNKKQKAAYVHYKMGKLVSYVPDYNFNIRGSNSQAISGTRNIWKSLVGKKSICSGITAIEQNIFSRLGIKTTELSSGVHSYLLIETEDGNIITDATWDLTGSLYGGRPRFFGVTYQELCEEENGKSNSHRLKHQPEDVVKISDEELRKIYQSIGVAREDGKFPLPILEKTLEINSRNYKSIEDKLTEFFAMFTRNFEEEARHLSETRNILQQCLEELGIDRKLISTRFVYRKSDIQCVKPYLIIHINSKSIENKIFLLNIEKMRFESIDIQILDMEYMVHRQDMSEPFWKRFMQTNKIVNLKDLNDKNNLEIK